MTCGSDAAGAQRADDAEEARVAGGQHGYVAGARVQGVEGLVEVLDLFAFRAGGDPGMAASRCRARR